MRTKIILIAVVLVLVSSLSYTYKMYTKECKERERQESNVGALMSENQHYKVRDSLNAVTTITLRLSLSELQKYKGDYLALLKINKIKPSRVESLSSSKVETRDTIPFYISKDSCFHYKDKWTKIDACISSKKLIYSVSDSIVRIVHRRPAHRFLWWKWGTKDIAEEVINFNPHSKIVFNEIIKCD